MTEPPILHGLHHVTAVTADARRNLAFYTRILGMRLVKKTVNQDDVSAYHLFYADGVGQPGTELTFFEWTHVPPARPGAGAVTETALRVSGGASALDLWCEWFDQNHVRHGAVERPSSDAVLPSLSFEDHEGQRLRLIAQTRFPADAVPWSGSPLPPEASIFALGAVTLTVRDPAPTARLLTEVLGFRPSEHDATLLETGAGGPGTQLRLMASDAPAVHGGGGVHHVAWMVSDVAEQQEWLDHLAQHRVANSGLVDRFYFQSVYFRVPGDGSRHALGVRRDRVGRLEPLGDTDGRVALYLAEHEEALARCARCRSVKVTSATCTRSCARCSLAVARCSSPTWCGRSAATRRRSWSRCGTWCGLAR